MYKCTCFPIASKREIPTSTFVNLRFFLDNVLVLVVSFLSVHLYTRNAVSYLIYLRHSTSTWYFLECKGAQLKTWFFSL